ncbi:uncharacterized protein AMSG_04700 [Thecamonas trahens ATCC 50062]|uniref:DUF4211 domain-containing protein n=1 Tax=Thecamonas trahens ATCC 50062 TaxID=461836 RepID=A0A0L0D9M9_THETB|nr:hypothetical protein AMSG_04700 [Thecamonas trahens ATCC 50062]KNC48955.1 hypothetical protein AMSG_04700 [Thecamonas trahens ATCC 50062]|eukprot:XP_013758372.1 hypothetical protein AMSG_04700 [Thecamonas trahens ATCC 50062]
MAVTTVTSVPQSPSPSPTSSSSFSPSLSPLRRAEGEGEDEGEGEGEAELSSSLPTLPSLSPPSLSHPSPTSPPSTSKLVAKSYLSAGTSPRRASRREALLNFVPSSPSRETVISSPHKLSAAAAAAAHSQARARPRQKRSGPNSPQRIRVAPDDMVCAALGARSQVCSVGDVPVWMHLAPRIHGRVLAVFDGSAEVQLFATPQQTHWGAALPCHGKGELLRTRLVLVVPLASLEAHISIEPLRAFQTRFAHGAYSYDPDRNFYFTSDYDAHGRALVPLGPSELEHTLTTPRRIAAASTASRAAAVPGVSPGKRRRIVDSDSESESGGDDDDDFEAAPMNIPVPPARSRPRVRAERRAEPVGGRSRGGGPIRKRARRSLVSTWRESANKIQTEARKSGRRHGGPRSSASLRQRPTAEWLEGMAAYLAASSMKHEQQVRSGASLRVRPTGGARASEVLASDDSLHDFVVDDLGSGTDEVAGGRVHGAGGAVKFPPMAPGRRLTNACPLLREFGDFVHFVAACFVDASFCESVAAEDAAAGAPSFLLAAARKLRNALDVRKDSLVRSNSWRIRFSDALEAHPQLEGIDLSTPLTHPHNAVPPSSSESDDEAAALESGCEACGVSTHTARHAVLLGSTHARYDASEWWIRPWSHPNARGIAVALAGNSTWIGSMSSSEARPGTRFELGSLCFRRALLFHRLHHFAFKLALRVRRKILTLADELSVVLDSTSETQETIQTRALLVKSLLHSSEWFAAEHQELTTTIDAADALRTR